MASYFILKNSDGTREKRFRVVQGGYSDIFEKVQQVNKTIDGNLDVSIGSIQQRYMFSVRVRHTEVQSIEPGIPEWGNLGDLKYFYMLNNPAGTPSNEITFTNHAGDQTTVIMAGDFNTQTQGVLLEGPNAWFLVNCVFMKVG
jgi:hypothetical protein